MIEALETHYGRMFVPDTDAGQYWWLTNTGASPEDEFIEAVCAILDDHPRGTAVDVGANFGCWTLALANHAHSVVAIEPQRCCFDLLSKSVSFNRATNIKLIHAAVGHYSGDIMIPELDIEQASNFGGVSLAIPHHEQPNAKMNKVRMLRLDDVLRGSPVSFIKIDVEGFEANVIDGASATIARCHPVLFVEMDHNLTDADSLKSTIEEFGYVTEKRGGNFLCMPL